MVKIRVITLVLIAQVSSSGLLSQNPENKPILFNDLREEFCAEIVKRDLDLLLIETHRRPGYKGLVIFHGSRILEGRNLSYLRSIKNYLRFRGVGSEHLTLVRGRNEDKIRAELWQIPINGVSHAREASVPKKKILKTVLFDRSWADWYKSVGDEWTIYSGGWVLEGCGFDPNFDEFSSRLLADDRLTGYIVILNSENQAKKVKKFSINELVKKFEVPRKRLKVVVVNKAEKQQIELWLVPNGEPPPLP